MIKECNRVGKPCICLCVGCGSVECCSECFKTEGGWGEGGGPCVVLLCVCWFLACVLM